MCVEPNDAERHSLHESDAEISELESEILALKVEGKKLLNIKWNVTSLFFKEYWRQHHFNPAQPERAFSGVKFLNVKGHLISNKP